MEGRRTALPAFKDASSSLLRKCWFCIFVANFVEALVEKCPIRQKLRQRLPTKFSAPLTFATALVARESHASQDWLPLKPQADAKHRPGSFKNRRSFERRTPKMRFEETLALTPALSSRSS